jgi:hypothetical protein
MAFMITEGIADTVVVYLIIKKLSTPFEEWDAYKMGIIDEKGKKIRSPKGSKERKAWTVFDRFIANLKRIMTKFVGRSRMAALVTAAVLLRDSMTPLLNGNMLTERMDGLSYTAMQQLSVKRLINGSELPSVSIPEDNEEIQAFEFNVEKYIPIISAMLEDKSIDEFFEVGEDI